MRIALVCNDTRGGIQPYVALGLGLRSAGHEVRAVAPSDLAPMFSKVGISVTPLSGSIEAVLRGSGGIAEQGLLKTMQFAAREMPARMKEWTKETLQGCEGVDAITGGIGGMVIGEAVAEKLGVPFIETHLQPVGCVTDRYPGALFPNTPAWLGGWGRRMSHHLTELGVWGPFRGVMTKTRKEELGLRGKARVNRTPVLYGISRHVIDVPTSPARPRHTTGYWFMPRDANWQAPQALQEFLAEPGPVVSIGFGSMTSERPEKTTELVLGAIRDAKVRAVLLSGWGGLHSLEGAPDVLCADALPHDWLFPRVHAVVHHGGAGTTGAALASGTPSLVVPFTMDQPFWGARVAALGVGASPIPRRNLTRAALANSLRQLVDDAELRARARSLGEAIRAEDGVGTAVRLLGEVLETRPD